jgi:hypothetical protein
MGHIVGRAKLWLIYLVPAIAVLVFARQVYLATYAELSTWKGGGMGMFAAADGTTNRFAKIYILSPKQGRQPVVRLTIPQKRDMDKALWYPVRERFAVVARSIFATSWAAGDQLTPVSLVDEYGEPVGKAARSHYMLMPYGVRAPGDKPDWAVEIEYWAMAYDPASRRLRARHVKTHRFEVAS